MYHVQQEVVVILHSVWAPEPQRAGANDMTKQQNDALERLPQLQSRVCGALPNLARALSRLLPCRSWPGRSVNIWSPPAPPLTQLMPMPTRP
jgi:hypothetical protein